MMEAEKLQQKIKMYLPVFAGNMFFSLVVYYLLMSHHLVNANDGLWEYSYYKAGKWSLSLGRWFWLYWDRLHFGISTEPVASLIALACFSGGMIFVLDLFGLGKRKIGYLASMLFLSSTCICISLSYRFMSSTFGMAFLLSVLAVWMVAKLKNFWLSVGAGGILIALMMGLYQAYLGCVCLVFVGYFLCLLSKEDMDLHRILANVGKAAVSGILGGILYVLVLKVHLNFFHMSLSSYNGADTYSLGNTIKNLPGSIVNSYQIFFLYFKGKLFYLNALSEMVLYSTAFLLAAIFLLKGFVKIIHRSKPKALLYAVLVMLIPVACNMVLLVATAADTSLLMTAAMALCLPVLLCVEAGTEYDGSPKLFLWVRRLNLLWMLVILYGNIYQVQIDQNAMLEGERATITMAREIIHRLDEEEYLDPSLEFCILGIQAYNELFQTSILYDQANRYAQFGVWYRDPTCTRRSWQGVFSYLCGINLPMCMAGDYYEVEEDERVQNMPVYPKEGFISRFGDLVVIKVSE